MLDIKKRLYFLLAVIFTVFIMGSLGYYILYGGRYNLLDCIFMTVISLTSVGYGEVVQVTGNPKAQIFTIALITLGMGVILYGLSTLTALLIEGELTDILRKKKMENAIAKLRNHYILCGGGETGRPLLTEMIINKETAVLVESDRGRIDACLERHPDLLFIQGDCTDDQNLIRAGIAHAAGIVISLPSDKDNLYITMTARMLNRDIRIIARMTDEKIREKLKRAGADSVVSPNFIGALRMASEMLRPAAVDFLDQMLRSNEGNLRIHELPITGNSAFFGKKIMESGIKDKYKLLVLGIKDTSGEIVFNPPPQLVLENGMTLIIMGETGRIKKARDAA